MIPEPPMKILIIIIIIIFLLFLLVLRVQFVGANKMKPRMEDEILVREQEGVSIPCWDEWHVKFSEAKYRWEDHLGRSALRNDMNMLGDGTMEIKSARTSDTSSYVCTVESAGEAVQRFRHNVTVYKVASCYMEFPFIYYVLECSGSITRIKNKEISDMACSDFHSLCPFTTTSSCKELRQSKARRRNGMEAEEEAWNELSVFLRLKPLAEFRPATCDSDCMTSQFVHHFNFIDQKLIPDMVRRETENKHEGYGVITYNKEATQRMTRLVALCDKGYELVDGILCLPCRPGHFKDKEDEEQNGEVVTDTRCRECPRDTWESMYGSRTCRSCPESTSNLKKGSTQESDCKGEFYVGSDDSNPNIVPIVIGSLGLVLLFCTSVLCYFFGPCKFSRRSLAGKREEMIPYVGLRPTPTRSKSPFRPTTSATTTKTGRDKLSSIMRTSSMSRLEDFVDYENVPPTPSKTTPPFRKPDSVTQIQDTPKVVKASTPSSQKKSIGVSNPASGGQLIVHRANDVVHLQTTAKRSSPNVLQAPIYEQSLHEPFTSTAKSDPFKSRDPSTASRPPPVEHPQNQSINTSLPHLRRLDGTFVDYVQTVTPKAAEVARSFPFPHRAAFNLSGTKEKHGIVPPNFGTPRYSRSPVSNYFMEYQRTDIHPQCVHNLQGSCFIDHLGHPLTSNFMPCEPIANFSHPFINVVSENGFNFRYPVLFKRFSNVSSTPLLTTSGPPMSNPRPSAISLKAPENVYENIGFNITNREGLFEGPITNQALFTTFPSAHMQSTAAYIPKYMNVMSASGKWKGPDLNESKSKSPTAGEKDFIFDDKIPRSCDKAQIENLPDLPPRVRQLPDLPPKSPPDLPPKKAPELPPRKSPELPPKIPPDLPPRAIPELPPKILPDLPPRNAPEFPPKIPPGLPPRAFPELPPKRPPDLPPRKAPQLPPKIPPGLPLRAFPELTPKRPPDLTPRNAPELPPKIPRRKSPALTPKRPPDLSTKRSSDTSLGKPPPNVRRVVFKDSLPDASQTDDNLAVKRRPKNFNMSNSFGRLVENFNSETKDSRSELNGESHRCRSNLARNFDFDHSTVFWSCGKIETMGRDYEALKRRQKLKKYFKRRRMASENIQNEEDILSYIYQGCDKEESGMVTPVSLIKFIQASSNRTEDEVFHQRLLEHFDQSGQNLALDFEKFRELMISFIRSARSDENFSDNRLDSQEKYSYACSPRTVLSPPNLSRFSNSSTFSNISTEAADELNMADDQIIQLQVENKALKEVAKSLEATKDLLHQRTVDLDEMRSRAIHYQEQWSECEDNVAKIELTNQKLRIEASETRNRINFVLKERDEVDDANLCLRKEVKELTEEKLKIEKSMELYKIMYLQKSDEYQCELKKCQEVSLHADAMRMENEEFQCKLKETEEKLREREIDLNSYIHQSSLGSIDEEDIPTRLISRNHKSQILFGNRPNLCQELLLSLMESPAFPSPMRDFELRKALASSTRLEDVNDPLPVTMSADNDLLNCSEENSSFLRDKRSLLMEDLAELATKVNKAEVERKTGAIVDDFVGILQAKLSAELKCLSLKMELSQQSELNEVLQQQICDMEEKIKVKEHHISMMIMENINAKDLEIIEGGEVSKRGEATSTGYASDENLSKLSGDSDDGLIREKDETISTLEMSMSFLKEDLKRRAALSEASQKDGMQLTKHFTNSLSFEGELVSVQESNGLLPARISVGVQVEDDLRQNNSKAPVTCSDITSSQEFQSLEPILAAGDSGGVVLFGANHKQVSQVPLDASGDKSDLCGKAEKNPAPGCRKRCWTERICMPPMLWTVIFSLIITVLFTFRVGNISDLVTNIVDSMPPLELHHLSAPPT